MSLGSLHIVFNGEIYNFLDLRRELMTKGHNFPLRQRHRGGAGGLSGMGNGLSFAPERNVRAGAVRRRRRRLFLARDRAGEKPLFYAMERGELRFPRSSRA